MNAIGASLTIGFCIALLVLPRHRSALTFISAVLYITQGQTINLGINFMAIRFVEVAAFLSLVIRGELPLRRLSKIDKFLFAFLLSFVTASSIRNGTIGWYELGLLVDGTLVYLTFRALITTPEEYINFMKGVSVLILPFAFLMIVESIKGQNLFSFMGGVPLVPDYRDGHFRCQGSFRHAITAGSLGATFAPLFFGCLFYKSCRIWASLGLLACFSIILASHSSGPLMAAVTAAVSWCCWVIRDKMKLVRRGILLLLVALHLAMSKPVWFIFDRLSGILGGDGWHRSILIDRFFRHFFEWWLVGMPYKDTATWAATKTKEGGIDVTNYYVSIGMDSGLLSLILFIAMLTFSFKFLGAATAETRELPEPNNRLEPLIWGIGCCICTHAVNLTSVVYFDQFYVIWYLHLAIAASLVQYVFTVSAEPDRQLPEKVSSEFGEAALA